MLKKPVVLIVIAAGLFTACRKERTCECEITQTFTPANGGTAQETKRTWKMTKEKQKAKEFRKTSGENGAGCYYYTTSQTKTEPAIWAGTYVDSYECEVK